MKNKGDANTTAVAAYAHFNHTPSNADKLVLEYKTHILLMFFLYHH
jgi:hypothetical protein